MATAQKKNTRTNQSSKRRGPGVQATQERRRTGGAQAFPA
jgi:hypothetical protein